MLLPPNYVPPVYADGRPAAPYALYAEDFGPVFRHGSGPDGCDRFGAREASIVFHDGRYHLFYDGAGPTGWLACVAVSDDLRTWSRRGPVLSLGKPGERDAGSASAPWFYHEGDTWHMFYLGAPYNSGGEDKVPVPPYWTCKARAKSLLGPWEKQDVIPFSTCANSYRTLVTSPGCVIRHEGEYLQFFSSTNSPTSTRDAKELSREELLALFNQVSTPGCRTPYHRTLGLARTRDLNAPWTCDPEPVFPTTEQVENSSLYYEPANGYWFLFTNHIGMDPQTQVEYTDAIWVYWSKDPLRWDRRNKAVVLDGSNCRWSPTVIGMPSVLKVGDRLAIFYDAHEGPTTGHMNRDIGLAWLSLPLQPPVAR